ncbi:response regulator transcription factor [Akkermansiaceae bacterium]|nr:response regulator transcription factor [Akkermansiaceae bacterium]MDB4411032.1 response regulator transcription factor [bacterium]MDB4412062.1 response regulator transcription factor [Akkermansiaceae bacterium]MDB4440244.1 response regulator transcription factor [bacterium]MDB4547305.1 response regulator transcription factor [Akkermansiaceae bacterium]
MPDSGSKRLLVIDDDRKLCGLIHDYLEPLGYEVSMRHRGDEGLAEALEGDYEAVLLDIMMPGMDGFEVLKELRKTSQVPVLMLTAMGDEADRIVGLELGADDYLPKTFSTRELLARLRAVTRRVHQAAPAPEESEIDWVVGEIRLNEGTHTVTLAEEPLDLTALEFAMLACLMRSRGRVKSREQLIDEVSERKFDVFDRSIDVHISALRKKLGDDAKHPRYIRTVRGVGYQLFDPERA